MAANEVKLTIKVGDDGSLDVVAKKANKAAKETEKIGKATDTTRKSREKYNKGEKGVAGATSNSTKAFSKMRESMTGSSGLVPAYATLAANVFALSAAFSALKTADAFRLLEQGLIRVGAAAGRNLPYVADRLKEITGEAISTRDAMEAVALGAASGFNQEQIEGLATVARGASTALGRDMTDALSRLTRGAAKLEPEILDELGIMVRLDDATTTYASTLGKTADQLSIVERRQAFTNAILEQGIKKYGTLSDTIDPSSYDKLAASFDELAKASLNLINKGLEPIVGLLANNKNALTGAAILFGSTISRQMLPALYDGAAVAAANADALADQAAQSQANIKTTGAMPKVYKALSSSIQDGTATKKEYDSALGSLDKSLSIHRSQLVGVTREHGLESTAVATKKEKIQQVTAARRTLLTTMSLQSAASAKLSAANAIEAASALNLKTAYNFVRQSILEYIAAQNLAALSAGKTVGIFGLLQRAGYGLALSFRVVGAALLASIPIIGQVILVGSLLFDYFKDLIFEVDETEQAINKMIASFDSFGVAAEELQRKLKTSDTPTLDIATTMAGVYGEATSRFNELQNMLQDNRTSALDALQTKLSAARDELKAVNEDTSFSKAYREFVGMSKSAGQLQNDIRRLKEEIRETGQQDVTVLGTEGLEGARKLLQGLIDRLDVFPDRNKDAIQNYQYLLDTFNEDTPIIGASAAIEAVGFSANGIVAAMESSSDAFSKFREASAKYEKRQQTPFDDMINQSVILRDALGSITDEQAKNQIIKNLGEPFTRVFGNTEESVISVTNAMLKNQQVLIKNPGLIKQEEQALKQLNKVRRESPLALESALLLENSIATKKKETLEAEQNLINLSTANTADSARYAELTTLINAEKEKILKVELIAAEVEVSRVREAQSMLKIVQKIAASKRQEFESQVKLQRLLKVAENARDPLRSDISLTAKQEKDIFEDNKKKRLELARTEQGLKIQAINMEYDLLDAQAALLRERLVAADISTDSLDRYISKLGPARDAAIDAQIEAGRAALQEITNTGLQNDVNAQNAAIAAASQGSSTSGRFDSFSQEGGFGALDTINERIQASRSLLEPIMEDLKKLGPDGELVAAIAQGSLAIADSMSAAFESGAKGMEGAAGKAQAVADTIGAVNSIMQAGIQATIAKIDDQIAAEKKRDGKSAQSVAKIQSLEKKKEAQQRKAFETNKKMLMAQTVANTAAGVMRAIAEGGIAGIVIAGVIAAMGAAQLSIISSQTYQGGSSSAPSGPTGIAMGSRRNGVDLAKSQSARGELAYFRGESGSGGPESFKPAFSGYKNRAEGGNTAYMVGEQGPELFVPERPGRIVANDDVSMGAPTNVSFNINTVDSSGVEDLLVAQRGNIIGMIRQAANSYGQDFVEDVDTSVFTQSSGGVSRY